MEKPVDAWVRHHARLAPDRPAVRDGDLTISYRQLLGLADQWAARLRHAGVGPGDLVALQVPRGAGAVAAMIGVLSVGAVFAPLDDTDPPARREAILRQACPQAVISGRTADPTGRSVTLEVTRAGGAPPASRRPRSVDDAAYVMFTSGSTGTPKGVVVGHRAIVNLVCEPRFGFRPGTVVGHASNQAFDASTFEIWGALCHGGTLVPLDLTTLLNPPALRAALARHGIEVMFATTSVFHFLVDADPSLFARLALLVFGGEQASAPHVNAAAAALAGAGPRMLNGYGPTECTTFATLADMGSRRHASRVPIGTPVHNVGCHLRDGGSPAAEGELYVTGPGVAHGYWRSPALTAERFVEIDVDGQPQRAYRTGDQCRVEGGELYFLGRRDGMVKLRGHRIELGDIESNLREHPAVRDVCVLLLEPASGPELVAFVKTGGEVSLSQLRDHAGRRLPPYMLPTRMVALDAMPFGPTGKVDRTRLAHHATADVGLTRAA